MKDPKTVRDFENTKYSEEQIRVFMKKYPKKVDDDFWWRISKYQDLSEPFIKAFKDQVIWWAISEFQDLSEDFIRAFKDKVDWWCISIYQDLSEPFIGEFKDQVIWWRISKYQDLSEEFLIEFIKDIVIGDEGNWGLIDNKKVPEDVKKRIINLKKIIDQ